MLPRFHTLLQVAVISGAMAFHSPIAHAITVTRAEVQWGDAVVMGRGAAADDTIYWGLEPVSTANKRGKFSFEGAVPPNCIGALSTDAYPDPIDVELDNCTPDSGEPEPIAVLDLYAEQQGAHNGEAVRAVGFVVDNELETWVISGGEDANLRTWNLQNLQAQSSKSLDHTIYDFEISADGSIVATGEGGWNGGPGSDTLRIWPADDLLDPPPADPVYIGTTAPIGFVYCVAISPYDPDPAIDSFWTVASGFYGDIVVYETSSLELYATKNTKLKRTKALAFSPDGTILASTSTAGRIQLWSFPKDECDSVACELERLPVSLSHGGSWVFPIAIAPYSASDVIDIVSGSDGGMTKLWKIDLTKAPPDEPAIAVDSGAVYSLAYFSPPGPDGPMINGSMIVAGGNNDITVYDAATLGILAKAVNAHDGRVNDVAFSPDGSFIVSGGADGALKLWDLGAE